MALCIYNKLEESQLSTECIEDCKNHNASLQGMHWKLQGSQCKIPSSGLEFADFTYASFEGMDVRLQNSQIEVYNQCMFANL